MLSGLWSILTPLGQAPFRLQEDRFLIPPILSLFRSSPIVLVELWAGCRAPGSPVFVRYHSSLRSVITLILLGLLLVALSLFSLPPLGINTYALVAIDSLAVGFSLPA